MLVAIGASVGIGNIWKFPYMVGSNGGSAFVLVYLGCVIFVAIPLLITELLIGQRAAKGPPLALADNASAESRSSKWVFLGWLYLGTGFLILSFFSVVSGWILVYLLRAVTGGFIETDKNAVIQTFNLLLQSPWQMASAHFVFMCINVVIVSFGLKKGIERISGVFMPSFFVLLIMMLVFSLFVADPSRAFAFLFHFQFEKINADVVLMAIGQSFLSIGLCSGMMMICGAHLQANVSIPRTAVIIASADTMVALCAGLVIFPLVFEFALQPTQGPGLIFNTLPLAFAQMPFGSVFSIAFFLLLFFASVTSSVALLEHNVAWCHKAFDLARARASLLIGALAWILGLLSVFSFNLLADIHPLSFLNRFENKTIFDVLDYLATNVLLVVGGFLLAVFAGWVLSKNKLLEDLQFHSNSIAEAWYFCLRYIAPLALGLVIISNLKR